MTPNTVGCPSCGESNLNDRNDCAKCGKPFPRYTCECGAKFSPKMSTRILRGESANITCGQCGKQISIASNVQAPPLPPKLARRVAMSEQHREDEEAVRKHYDEDLIDEAKAVREMVTRKEAAEMVNMNHSTERTATQMVLAEREACAKAICYLCAAGVPMDRYRQFHMPTIMDLDEEEREPLPCEAAAIHARGLV